MNFVYDAFQSLIKAGPYVLLPLIITVVGLAFRMNIAKAFRSGLTVGIGFVGIKLVIDMLAGNIGPASKAMVENFGLNLDIIDVGWGAIASVTWASPIIPIIIGIIFLTNLLMLVTNTTDTLDVDIWNYHHMAIVGCLLYFLTNNLVLAGLSAFIMAFITFKLSDWTSPLIERYFGIPNVSLPTMSFLSTAVIAYPMNWLIDKIPGLNKINLKIDNAQKYLGVFGEQTILGFILGCAVGILAKYAVWDIINLGVHMAAVMVLIPKMTSLFVEGLMPISEAATNFTKSKFKNRKFLIGLDAAVVVGDSTVITTALILIPLTILLSAFLPGNRVMPFADLAVITFRVALIVALTNGNLFRSIVIGAFTTTAILYAGTATSPFLTDFAVHTGLDFGGQLISSFASVSLTVSYIVFEAFRTKPLIFVPILVVALIVIYVFAEKKYKKFKADKEKAGM
ncbi:PTS galactitol transporter subunit IIC [Helcococcus kunzii]|uniref:PTS galactitol transporter subunit IIC n=1 Tax=Helcococcus kunzii TaxID=40091 RepID=UPI001BB04966|nr:PTS transporter subunit IIC [Helcococcus kunzii]QUY65488.1 PTS galactitol transporter subunit IIC [Helcococcus kunzii]